MSFLRWLFVCRCGRRCANAVVSNVEPPLPPEVTLVVEYVCDGCGTRYVWDTKTMRRRMRIWSHPPGKSNGL